MTTNAQPSPLELIQAIAALSHPPVAAAGAPQPLLAPEERGLAKHAATIIVAIILALCLWVGSSVSSLSTAVTKMQGTMDGVQRSVTDLQTSQTTALQQVSELRASVAKGDARADAIEADASRMKERIRVLEGLPPLVRPGER